MKNRDLIKLLENHPDDKEIYVWNGFVGDWMDFTACDYTLVKERYQHTSRFEVTQPFSNGPTHKF